LGDWEYDIEELEYYGDDWEYDIEEPEVFEYDENEDENWDDEDLEIRVDELLNDIRNST